MSLSMSWSPQHKPVINSKRVACGSEVLLLDAATALRVFGWLGCALGVLGAGLTFLAHTYWSLLCAVSLAILAPLAATVGHAVLCGFSDLVKLLKKSAGIGYSGTLSGANVPYTADSTEGGPYFLRGESQKPAGPTPAKCQSLPPKS